MMPLHPVPLSSNGGATLDWTGSGSEDDRSEKRWSLHRTRRKHKDRFSMPSGRSVVEKQDSLYAGISLIDLRGATFISALHSR